MNNNLSNDNNALKDNKTLENDSSNNILDINILKSKIQSAEDFLNNLKEENILFLNQKNLSDKNYSIKEFSVIKNYLNTSELSKILNFTFLSFVNTTYINLTANELNFIPSEFSNLLNLEILILNNNKISKIENLENLSKLKRLELRSNRIKEFSGLENKQQLEILTLSCNLIKQIEEEKFYDFPSLKEIGLFGNFLGDEKNMEENARELDKVLELLVKKASNITSIYLGGNHFLHMDLDYIKKRINDFCFKKLIKLDGQLLNK